MARLLWVGAGFVRLVPLEALVWASSAPAVPVAPERSRWAGPLPAQLARLDPIPQLSLQRTPALAPCARLVRTILVLVLVYQQLAQLARVELTQQGLVSPLEAHVLRALRAQLASTT